jgi:ABC-type dipeptide/oligopeptide/nickel transport system permease component
MNEKKIKKSTSLKKAKEQKIIFDHFGNTIFLFWYSSPNNIVYLFVARIFHRRYCIPSGISEKWIHHHLLPRERN